MNKRITSLLLAGLIAGSGMAQAGVVIGGTRIIYDGNKKESSIGIDNPDASPYLIQSWVENEAGKSDKGSFVITPPLFRLDGKQKNTLRVMQTTSAIAADRETLFWLNIKSIPTSDASAADNSLQIAVNTRIKLIYRPAALKGLTPDEASKQLKWARQGQNLTVNNPTPFYINFNAISMGGKPVENVTYVAPRSSATFAVPKAAQGNQVEWKVISDYGAISPAHQTSF